MGSKDADNVITVGRFAPPRMIWNSCCKYTSARLYRSARVGAPLYDYQVFLIASNPFLCYGCHMARPLRIEYPGAVYHVTSRGNEKKPVFKDDADRENFLNTLQHVNNRYNWICHAYCLMTNHYHLLIETPDGNLSLGMRQLNGVYTQLFNKWHGRTGHLFQGRYKAILIQKDSHLLEVCRYVVLNPVRAKMIEKPEEWKWSSYLATAGKTKPHPCLTTDLL